MNIIFKSIKNITEYNPSNSAILYITSEKNTADYLRSENEAVCINLESVEDLDKFPDYKYFIMDQGTNLGHLEKIYCHIKNLPYEIAVSDRLIIREEKPEDLDYIYKLYEDEESSKYLENLPDINSFDPYERFVSVKDGYMLYEYGMWIVELKESHEVIGRVGFEYLDENAVSIGFVIDKSQRKKGYALEACLLSIKYLNIVCPDLTIKAKCHRDNNASIALLKRLNIETLLV